MLLWIQLPHLQYSTFIGMARNYGIVDVLYIQCLLTSSYPKLKVAAVTFTLKTTVYLLMFCSILTLTIIYYIC